MLILFDSTISLLRIYPNKNFRDGFKYFCARIAKCIVISNSKKKGGGRGQEKQERKENNQSIL